MEEKVSIIVPIYNLEQYIENCIQSILAQTYKNIEVILINDGSTDNSGDICKKYQELDKRIKYIKQENGGVSSARNKGIEESTGEYIMFVDGDDYIAPNILETLMKAFAFDGVVLGVVLTKIVFGQGIEFENNNNNNIPWIETTEDYIQRYLFKKPYSGNAYAKIFKKSGIGMLRFPVNKAYNEDGYFCYRYCSNNKGKVCYHPEKLYAYFVRSDSASHASFNKKMYAILEIADMVYEECKTIDEFKEAARFNFINRRLEFLKIIIRSNQYKKERELVKQVKKEIMEMGLPNLRIPRIKRFEYFSLKLGCRFYFIFVKLYDFFKKK